MWNISNTFIPAWSWWPCPAWLLSGLVCLHPSPSHGVPSAQALPPALLSSSFASASSIEQQVWGWGGFLVIEVEGSPKVRKEEGLSAPPCTGRVTRICPSLLENDGSGKGQRHDPLNNSQMFYFCCGTLTSASVTDHWAGTLVSRGKWATRK